MLAHTTAGSITQPRFSARLLLCGGAAACVLTVALKLLLLALPSAPTIPAGPVATSSAVVEDFAAGGADSEATGFRMTADGRFALRADVVGALHSTLSLDLGTVNASVDVGGARIFGLYRGARDLSALATARVLVRGTCDPGATPDGGTCTAETVQVYYSTPGSFSSIGLHTPA